ncbi:MAG: TIGR03621 family F420-dependent LLM class oxidoreductase [Candidatus Limnocylindrales bacterium]
MSLVRSFRFSVMVSNATSAEAWRAKARRVEELGYSALLVVDHLGDQLAPVPALMAAFDATTRLRAGSFVFSNDYRNPVMLAKEIATLDHLSGGRVELGIGAGWLTRDYEILGIPYDPPAKRVDRLIEAVGLIDRLFTEPSVDAAGTHYPVRGATLFPKPLQRPRPPLMIGGGGPRMLRFAARHADIVALAPQVNADGQPHLAHLTTAATADKIRFVRAAAGTRFDDLELNVIVFDAAIDGEARSLLDGIAGRLKASAATLVDSPYFLYGSLDKVRRNLLERRERLGVSYYAIPEKVMEPFAPLARELAAV